MDASALLPLYKPAGDSARHDFTRYPSRARRSARRATRDAMTPEQQMLVKSSFAKVAPIADLAATLFYDELFHRDPVLGYGVKPTDYQTVGAALIATLQQRLCRAGRKQAAFARAPAAHRPGIRLRSRPSRFDYRLRHNRQSWLDEGWLQPRVEEGTRRRNGRAIYRASYLQR